MDFLTKAQSFDITHQVEQYKGKKLENFFSNQKVISNNMGEFLEIEWKLQEFSCNINLTNTRKKLLHNLKLVYLIGERVEKYLMGRGIRNLFDLKCHLRYRISANKIINLIKKKDYKTLSNNKYINDFDLLFCFSLEDLLFIDIETLGIYDSPLFIIGLGYFKENVYEIHTLFARNLEEEIAICEYFKTNVLPKFKCFISYNGKSFDIPYIANRCLYYFDENPMISKSEIPYENSNTLFHHVDLYHNCRRKYKGMYNDYTLTNLETELLNWKRTYNLPSSLVGLCYRKYINNPERYIGLVKDCIEHNYSDVYILPLILRKLLED